MLFRSMKSMGPHKHGDSPMESTPTSPTTDWDPPVEELSPEEGEPVKSSPSSKKGAPVSKPSGKKKKKTRRSSPTPLDSSDSESDSGNSDRGKAPKRQSPKHKPRFKLPDGDIEPSEDETTSSESDCSDRFHPG